jgi:hypothetical protein
MIIIIAFIVIVTIIIIVVIVIIIIISINIWMKNTPSVCKDDKNAMNYNRRLRNFRTVWHVPSTAGFWILLEMRLFKIWKIYQTLLQGLRRHIICWQDYWYYCHLFRVPLLFSLVC